MASAAGLTAVLGMTFIAVAPNTLFLAIGVVIAGSSTGLASPPMAEAVSKVIERQWQDRANTFINSGTSVGVALSGPVALVATGQWRLAWAAFAATGLLVLAWNITVMPDRSVRNEGEVLTNFEYQKPAEDPPRLTFDWFVSQRSLPLFAASVGLGIASAAYWTFSRDLIIEVGEQSPVGSTVFWVVLGVSGLAGGAAGDLIKKFGLRVALRGALLIMTASIGTLAVAPGILFVSYPSAALFGATYIMLTGILLVWAVRVSEERPSAGLGSAFLLLAAGQILGSYFAGVFATATSLQTTFLIFAGIAVLATVASPNDRDS